VRVLVLPARVALFAYVRYTPTAYTDCEGESERASENGRNREDCEGWKEEREKERERERREKVSACTRACRCVYVRCHGNHASKQACAFFNSNALPGKRWGYNEVPTSLFCSSLACLLARSLLALSLRNTRRRRVLPCFPVNPRQYPSLKERRRRKV